MAQENQQAQAGDHVIKIPDLRKAIYQIGGGTLAIIAVVSFSVITLSRDWLYGNFATRAELATVTQNIVVTNTRLDTLTLEMRLGAAISRVDSLKASIFSMSQHKENYGTSPAIEANLNDLRESLASAEAWRDCLIANNQNCELLRFH